MFAILVHFLWAFYAILMKFCAQYITLAVSFLFYNAEQCSVDVFYVVYMTMTHTKETNDTI